MMSLTVVIFLMNVMSADIKFEGQPLTKLEKATQDEVHDSIIKSPSNSCELDPLPTYLLKEVLEMWNTCSTTFDHGYYKQITCGVQGSAFFQKGQY